MAEIPRIKTPVESNGCGGVVDASGTLKVKTIVAYINATEAGLVELSRSVLSDDWAASAITKMKELGLWREPKP